MSFSSIFLPEVFEDGDDGEVPLCVALGGGERPRAAVRRAVLLAAAQKRLQRGVT